MFNVTHPAFDLIGVTEYLLLIREVTLLLELQVELQHGEHQLEHIRFNDLGLYNIKALMNVLTKIKSLGTSTSGMMHPLRKRI